MFTRPDGLTDADVSEALAQGWGLAVGAIDYAPVGFGSFHWSVTADDQQWFVTADDLVARRRHEGEPPEETMRRLSAALSTARALRDAGLGFVIAAEPSRGGALLEALGEHFAVALYPHVEGQPHSWGPYPSRGDRLAVLELIAAVHTTPMEAHAPALIDDLVIPSRDQLVAALADHAEPWTSGPFGEPARALLRAHAEAVAKVLDHYDQLAAAVAAQRGRMVLTHGEPHPGNTITTAEGVVLIDWDTALLAPPERDLWALAEEDPEILDAYVSRTGVAPRDDALELYRLWWDLTEVAIFISDFRKPHEDTDDTRTGWAGLNRYLDPSRWPAS